MNPWTSLLAVLIMFSFLTGIDAQQGSLNDTLSLNEINYGYPMPGIIGFVGLNVNFN